jgi:V/A-type H+-transporting ATPase subunit E
MADDLQFLIERIQKEAIQKSEEESRQMIAHARERAAALVQEAEQKAKALLEKADKDSILYAERATRTLEQAARDLLISVGHGIENILRELVAGSTREALDINTLRTMMLTIAKAYTERGGAESRIECLISEKDQEQIVRFFADQYAQRLIQGITIRADSGIHEGFRIMLKDGAVSHDFTREAIAEALSRFLRPHLAEIVHRAAQAPGNDPEK